MNIFKFFWFVYAVLLFIVSLILVYPIYIFLFIFYKNNNSVEFRISRNWGRFILMAFMIRTKIHFEEVLDHSKSYIFVSNHRSLADIPICSKIIPNHFKYLAKDELTKLPLFGGVIKGICFPVERLNNRNKIINYNKMKDSINSGTSVMIYPEGTRNKGDDFLGKLHNGAFRLAIETKKPLVIITLWNTTKIHPANCFFQLSPGKVNCLISKPIDTSKYSANDVKILKDKTSKIIIENIAKMIKKD